MQPARPKVNTGHRMPRGGGNCDFCGEPSVSKLYACRNFMWEGQKIFKDEIGRWAGCAACARLIEAKQWSRLSLRVMREVSKRQGLDADQMQRLAKTVRVLHKTFGLHMIPGEALGVILPRYSRVTIV